MFEIYKQGFSISMQFRRAKVEYDWLQSDPLLHTPSPEGFEVVATAGYPNLDEAIRKGNNFCKAFGEVIKLSGPLGEPVEGPLVVQKCQVILGPIPPKWTGKRVLDLWIPW